MRSDEAVGTHLFGLDSGLPTDDVKPLLRDVLADPSVTRQLSVDTSNGRGRPVTLAVTVTALLSHGDPTGVLLVMDAGPRD